MVNASLLVGFGFAKRQLANGQLFQLGEFQQAVPPGQVEADVLGQGPSTEEHGDERHEHAGVAGVPVGVDGRRVHVEAVLVVESLRRVLSGPATGLLSQDSGKHRGINFATLLIGNLRCRARERWSRDSTWDL